MEAVALVSASIAELYLLLEQMDDAKVVMLLDVVLVFCSRLC